MGSLKHPTAELSREAFAERDFRLAGEIVEGGLRQSPGHPDLTCEAAILAVYRAQEDQAFEFLPISERGLRFSMLTSLLADHYTSRILADRTDHDARRRLQLVRIFHPKESKHIGTRICACLIVKNEEKTLERCLKSLIGNVDQVVVVDTGSTDSTKQIAKAHGARVAEFVWNDDFSAARNYALSFATAHWILCIDADEELMPETRAAFERAVIRPQFGGFDIDIINFLDGENKQDRFCHSPTRLFRNLPGVQFSGRIHEQVNPSLAKLGLPWARLDGATILHYGYQPEVMVEKSKIDRTISLLQREVLDESNNSFQWFNLANAYQVANRYQEAKEAALNSLHSLTPANGYAAPTYCILIQALHALKEFDQAIFYADEAISKGLDCLQIAFEKCGALLGSERFDEALIQSEHMMSMEWTKGSTGDIGIFTHKRFVLRAQALIHFERYSEALICLEASLTAAPEYGPAQYFKGQVLEKLGQLQEAIQSYELASADPTCFEAAKAAAAQIYLDLGQFEQGAHLWFEVWMKNPGNMASWSRWKHYCEQTGKPMLVLECFEQLAALQTLSAEMMVDWGRTWASAGRHGEAIKCFAEAMRIEPTYANAYFNCGDVLYQTDAPGRAIEMYRAGLALLPDYAEGWFVFGNALAKYGREQESIRAFETALELAPDHAGAIHNLTVLRAA